MKKLLSILIICLLASSFAQAQKREKARERIKAMRVAFITEKLQLTPTESEQFWPVFNEFERERNKLRKEHKAARKGDDLSDDEAEAQMMANFDTQEQMIALKRKYFKKLKTILPVKKLARLEKAEREFKEVVVKEMRRRKAEQRQRRRRN